jgi:ABC-type cobalamin/Fe3+-siderophores transport system ATPase subunit
MRLAKEIEDEVEDATTYLSRSDRKLIHLARAFIYNPEVLVVHTPGIYFDKGAKVKIISTLRDFVQSRGVEMDPATLPIRRPRTCIFSTYDGADARYVDEMLYCEDGGIATQQDLGAVMANLQNAGDVAMRMSQLHTGRRSPTDSNA